MRRVSEMNGKIRILLVDVMTPLEKIVTNRKQVKVKYPLSYKDFASYLINGTRFHRGD